MAEVFSFGSYSISLTVVLVVLALVIGLALVVLFWLTVGFSVYRSVADARRDRVRDDLQDELVDRLFDPEGDWADWVAGFSAIEREVVESLLDEYVRELDGRNVESLRELGAELGIPDRAADRLQRSGEYDRLQALTWLTLLDRPDVLEDVDFTPGTARERAAVARLRYDCGALEEPRDGIALVLEAGPAQLSVFGQDTLFCIARDDPPALVEVAANGYRSWSEPLLVQVLVVARHVGANVTVEDLSQLTAAVEHESAAVREAATRALGNVGWRTDVRDGRFLARLTGDPSPAVRAAAYQTLSRWGDDQALETLVRGLETDEHPRARLAGTDALVGHRDDLPRPIPETADVAWAWSDEHASYDRVARRRSKEVGT